MPNSKHLGNLGQYENIKPKNNKNRRRRISAQALQKYIQQNHGGKFI